MLVLSACTQGMLAVSPGTIVDGVVLALNTAVFCALSLYPALYAITFVAVFWRACIGEPGFGPALLRPDKRRWTERQCPACARWNDRTAESWRGGEPVVR